MIKALLIHPPSPVINGSPPLSLGYIGAALKNKGCLVKIIDAAAPYARFTISDIIKESGSFKPDLIAITISTTFVKFAYKLQRALSETFPLIIAGGPHPTLLPDEVLENGADIVIKGEGEEIILDILRFMKGEAKLKDVTGISYKNDRDEIVHNPCRSPIGNLDNIPLPAKDLFKHSDYVKSSYEFMRYGNIITSRGCPYGCIFCSSKILGKDFRCRSAENVIKEIRWLQEMYGIDTFFILDDVFTYDKQRVFELCRLFRTLPRPIKWTCISRFDLITEELLEEMKEAGCYSITYGIETGSPETMTLIKKKIDLHKVEDRINTTARIGIRPHVSFMFGFPWEKSEHISSTYLFLKRILSKLTYVVNGGILIPYPGTALYSAYNKTYDIKKWWLRLDLAWWAWKNINNRPSTPVFERLFFKDFFILRMNFFKHSHTRIREIKRIIRLIGIFNIWMYANRLTDMRLLRHLYKNALLALVNLSRLVHRVDPRIEKKLSYCVGYFIKINIPRLFIEK